MHSSIPSGLNTHRDGDQLCHLLRINSKIEDSERLFHFLPNQPFPHLFFASDDTFVKIAYIKRTGLHCSDSNAKKH